MSNITDRFMRAALESAGFTLRPHDVGYTGIREADSIMVFGLSTGDFRLAYFDDPHRPIAEGRGYARLARALSTLPAIPLRRRHAQSAEAETAA